jgi:hypothetical protein
MSCAYAYPLCVIRVIFFLIIKIEKKEKINLILSHANHTVFILKLRIEPPNLYTHSFYLKEFYLFLTSGYPVHYA